MTTAIYIRTSTTEQNPENQLEACKSLAKEEFMIFEDQQSAWKDNKERAEFEKLRDLIKNRKLKNLIVWDLDRLFRNRKRIIDFFQFCKLYGCQIHSYRQKWLEEFTAMPEPWNEIMFNLMLQIMGWLAEEESTKKSQRVKLAVRKKGKQTISYKGNKWGRKSISTQKKNQILALREGGASMRYIAIWLDISIGVVHKTIAENMLEKNPKSDSSQINQ